MKERYVFIVAIIVLVLIQLYTVSNFKKQRQEIQLNTKGIEDGFFNQLNRLTAFNLASSNKFLFDASGKKHSFNAFFKEKGNSLFIRQVKESCDICIVETLKKIELFPKMSVYIIIPDTSKSALFIAKNRYGAKFEIFGVQEGDFSPALDLSKSSYCFVMDKNHDARMIFFPSYDNAELIEKYLIRITAQLSVQK